MDNAVNKIWRIAKYDFINDASRTIKYYLIIFLYIVADCTMLRISIIDNPLVDGSYVGLEGYLWKMLGGCDYFDINNRDITLPVEYLFLGTIILLIITGYTSKEIKTAGYKCLLSSGSRKLWLAAKYVFTIVKTLGIILVIGLGILANCIFEGESFWRTNEGVITNVLKYPVVNSSYTVDSLLIAICTTLAFALIMVSLDSLLDSLYVLIVGCLFLVASCYIDSFLFSGSNFMLIRNVVRARNGTTILEMNSLIWIMAIAFMITGFVKIKKKEIIKKGIA